MKPLISLRSISSAALALAACSSASAVSGLLQVGGATRQEVRQAVQAHRAAQRAEVQREEAWAGRRLTPAELAELRSQVRQQWVPRYDASHVGAPAATAAPELSEPQPSSDRRALTLPRSQRH